MNDALLEQIQQASTRHGPEKARQLASGLGLRMRDLQGQIMVPVIMERRATKGADFPLRLGRAGAALDAVSRSYARVLVPVQRLEQSSCARRSRPTLTSASVPRYRRAWP
jgi:hypothetical protein